MKQWIKIFGLVQLILTGSAVLAAADVTVANLVVAQRPGTKLVDITYDVSSTTTNVVTVSLSVSNGVAAVSAPSVSGAVGKGVATGAGKTITWNMGADWIASAASLSFSVRADTGVSGVPVGGDSSAVSWVVVNERWVKNTCANGHITMSDRTNNRMWSYDAYPRSGENWFNAMSYCDNLTYAGYSDWVLPDIDMLAGQFSQRGYFAGVQLNYYWSSTSVADNTNNAWYVDMYNGSRNNYSKESSRYGNIVWPVRMLTEGQAQAEWGASTALQTVDNRDYTLTVVSSHGKPSPSLGAHSNYCWQSTVICSVNSSASEGGTNYTCTGWAGTGSVPSAGATNNTGAIILTDVESSIAWQWQVQTADSDGDGLPDAWEILYFGNLTASNGTGDSDGDGMNDAQELIAGTSPTNSASVLAVQLSTASSANQVSWYGVSGRYYRLEYTDSLTNGWTPQGTVSSGDNAQIVELDIPGGGKRFYRIRVSDSPSGL